MLWYITYDRFGVPFLFNDKFFTLFRVTLQVKNSVSTNPLEIKKHEIVIIIIMIIIITIIIIIIIRSLFFIR